MTTTKLEIARGAVRGEQTLVTYEVPYDDGLTLLDAIGRIRRSVDPSLAVRFSCSANACKECSALINGRPGYLCATRAQPNTTTRIEPLAKPRLIRDLVTELH